MRLAIGRRDHVLGAIDAGYVRDALQEKRKRKATAEAEVERARSRANVEQIDRALVEAAVAAVHQSGDVANRIAAAGGV